MGGMTKVTVVDLDATEHTDDDGDFGKPTKTARQRSRGKLLMTFIWLLSWSCCLEVFVATLEVFGKLEPDSVIVSSRGNLSLKCVSLKCVSLKCVSFKFPRLRYLAQDFQTLQGRRQTPEDTHSRQGRRDSAGRCNTHRNMMLWNIHCNTMQHTLRHDATHTATHCNTMQHNDINYTVRAARNCNAHCDKLQHNDTKYTTRAARLLGDTQIRAARLLSGTQIRVARLLGGTQETCGWYTNKGRESVQAKSLLICF